MMIRETLDKDHETMSSEIPPFEKIFLGKICGIVLRKRGENDPHVCFQWIIKDDGHWFVSSHGLSSYWFDDYLEVLSAAKKWCEENCEPDIPDGRCQFGWKFKK